MATVLLGRLEVGARVPAARQLLDRGDVDDPVVQVACQLRHVAVEERPVRPDRVPGERGAARLGDPGADVVEDGLLRLLERGARVELVEQARRRVHLPHEVVHLLERGRLGPDHDVDPVAEDVELGVGDHRGDLDERVGLEVQARHLAVDPHDPVVVQVVRHGSRVRAGVGGAPLG